MVPAWTKVKDFRIVPINRKDTGVLGQVPIKVWQVLLQFYLAMSQALEFLKCDGLFQISGISSPCWPQAI